MKPLILSALLFTGLHAHGQDTSRLPYNDYGRSYTPPSSHVPGRCVGIHWEKRGWVITDTMGLINELERRLEGAYKEREAAEEKLRLYKLQESQKVKPI